MAGFGSTLQSGTKNLRSVTETITKNAIQVKLNNGSSASGTVLTVNAGFPTLNTDTTTYDAEKVINIVEALMPCLSKSVYAVQRTATSSLNVD